MPPGDGWVPLFLRVPLCVAVRGPGLHLQTPLSAQDASEFKALMGTLQEDMAFSNNNNNSNNTEGRQDERDINTPGLSDARWPL